ncbi:BA75_03598T0 [Komagataella pastoris]|uniref:Protein STU1 n=1 Tax=Komagataella pastoris TaxID=4922 RepID=A0A1B2JFS6_PICPA|nr:BA75_03598T0 [Komagataella pastoris]
MNNDAQELYNAVIDSNISYTEMLINKFKTHVKKDFVNLANVPKYFECLTIAINKQENEHTSIPILAFSTLCHLVKRVSMQDANVLKIIDYFALPVLIGKLDHPKSAVKNSAKKAIKVYWESCPMEVETAIRDHGLMSNESGVVLESLLLLLDMVSTNVQGFTFKPFTSKVVRILKSPKLELQNASKKLLIEFFTNCPNKAAAIDLAKELVKEDVREDMSKELLESIEPRLVDEYKLLKQDMVENNFVSAGSVAIKSSLPPSSLKTNTIRRIKSKPSIAKLRNHPVAAPPKSTLHHSSFSLTSQSSSLSAFLDTLEGYALEPNVAIHNISDFESFTRELSTYDSKFEGKETELNWRGREQAMILMRSTLRGNAPQDYPHELSQCIRLMLESISKAIMSLRTTLCSNGCQLVKEASIILNTHLDTFTIDHISTTLFKQCSATKRITSMTSMASISGILSNCILTSKLITLIQNASTEKNPQPRLYSAIWATILLYRYTDNEPAVFESNGLIEFISKILLRNLPDQSAEVRENMRELFWRLQALYPEASDAVFNRLDNNVKKALQRMKIKSQDEFKLKHLQPVKSTDHRQLSKESEGAKTESLLELGKPSRVPTSNKLPLLSSQKPHSSLGVRQSSGNESQRSSNDVTITKVPQSAEPVSTVFQGLTDESVVGSQKKTAIEADTPSPQTFENIFNLLSSSSVLAQKEGLSLLRFSLLMNETLPAKLQTLVNSISINDPTVLIPLLAKDTIVQLCKCISLRSILRMAVIGLETSVNFRENFLMESFVEQLSNSINDNEVCSEVIHTLQTCNDIRYESNARISMQIIKFKQPLIFFHAQFLLLFLERHDISDNYLTTLVETLLQNFDTIKDVEDQNSLSAIILLLKLLKSINIEVFNSCVGRLPSYSQSELNQAISLGKGKQKTLSAEDDEQMLDYGYDVEQLERSLEMTMINPQKANMPTLDNVDIKGDMTMIVPNMNSRDDTKVIEGTKELTSQLNFSAATVATSSNSHGDSLRGTSKTSTSNEGLQDIIEKSDPFNQQSNEVIEIYEDAGHHLENKIQQVSMLGTMDSWFDFELQKFSVVYAKSQIEQVDDFVKDTDLTAISHVDLLNLTPQSFYETIYHLRTTPIAQMEPVEKIVNKILLFLEQANKAEIGKESIMMVISLLKQCCVLGFVKDSVRLWTVILSLFNEVEDFLDELYFASQSLATHVNDPSVIIESLNEKENPVKLCLILSTLMRVELKEDSEADQTLLVIQHLGPLLNHADVSVRKYATQLYASLNVTHSTKLKSFLEELTPAQRQLVEYYQDNIK